MIMSVRRMKNCKDYHTTLLAREWIETRPLREWNKSPGNEIKATGNEIKDSWMSSQSDCESSWEIHVYPDRLANHGCVIVHFTVHRDFSFPTQRQKQRFLTSKCHHISKKASDKGTAVVLWLHVDIILLRLHCSYLLHFLVCCVIGIPVWSSSSPTS